MAILVPRWALISNSGDIGLGAKVCMGLYGGFSENHLYYYSNYCWLEKNSLLTIQFFGNPSCQKVGDLGHFWA
jgi:hypothetical protein